jgi:hypothetical protein
VEKGEDKGTYELAYGLEKGSIEAKSYFGGSNNFRVKEIEVY